MDNHDWKKAFRKVDSALATKYGIQPTIIHYLRVQSIRKNKSLRRIALNVANLLRHAIEHKRHGMTSYYTSMVNFVAGLTYEEWMEISSPNTENYKYMVLDNEYFKHQRHIRVNPQSDKFAMRIREAGLYSTHTISKELAG